MDLAPKEVVKELDKYIIGQAVAKKAVAIALRNRYRRSKLDKTMRDEITPKNIILKGPTGVGKTEIARRLAKLVRAPFIKVEATKFTEVGYVGRDVESMIRDLVEVSIHLVKHEKIEEVAAKVKPLVEKRLFDIIYPLKKAQASTVAATSEEALLSETVKSKLELGEYDNEVIELDVKDTPKDIEVVPGMGGGINIGNIFEGIIPVRKKRRKMAVKQAREILTIEESDKLIDLDGVNSEAIKRAEQEGIIFIDEIDKIASKGGRGNGPEVSREGVQRDILPIVEGSTVNTKYGMIRTDYILFIAAGAFHISKVEDLIPELQGRFPILVELDSLKAKDFERILTEPKNAITIQYSELFKVDNINLVFKKEAISTIAEFAEKENNDTENLGARRLHTVMEQLLEDISFNADGGHPMLDVVIDKEYVHKVLENASRKRDPKMVVGFKGK
ncbi:MAG: ATP-dependent protease ATPase subunit HslU [Christensenellaceae bacterium]|jgi:ATP-dependent HslUV protease ATP-binding subunit HslU|nr:ATP-dependent protease ATPase subunit HslU [Christensenellaceae bacterium]